MSATAPDAALRADVLIAGYGPVGAVLAALLGARGVSVLVVDPATEPHPRPRAAGLEAQVLRLLVGLPGMAGLLEQVLPSAGATYLGPDRRVLLTTGHGPAELGVPVGAFVYQPTVERALRAGIATLPGVRVRLGAAVTGLHQNPASVLVDLDDATVVQARFVVGCDGAASTVRTLMGVGYEGTTFAEPWLVVDVRGRQPLPVPGDLVFVLDPARPMVAMPVPGGHRFEWMLRAGEDPARMSRPDAVAGLLGSWIDPEAVEIERAAVYTFHARMARRWRVGRVLLAGDAAHTMPPFTGQGLNAGIGDAAALAWRLREVLAGLSDERGLGDYERERRARAAVITSGAVRAGRVIQTTSPGRAALCRVGLRAVARAPGLTSAVLRGAALRPRPRLPRVAGRGADRFAFAAVVLPNPAVRVTHDVRPGGGADGHLDDLLGPSWALLGLGVDPEHALSPAARAWLRARDATLLTVTRPGAAGPAVAGGVRSTSTVVEDLEGTLLRFLRRGDAPRLVVVRPDRHLLGVFPAPLPAGVLPGPGVGVGVAGAPDRPAPRRSWETTTAPHPPRREGPRGVPSWSEGAEGRGVANIPRVRPGEG
ncbi:3-(3-hydroxy-phenyl)propionate hydroxylase [Frankia sp. AiPs1]|uniref:FAD-dependent monooxygenase n=1 Tax=Frankia sp. AiPa1 TaxID=573492 RepID=UPI00202B91DC|nr:FAD-dependent monooxygenase [Frankia sp. AiPa1]MCL9762276.1 FAD-dependent monooxygenase [Frankia sp. AiPa1]